MTTTAPDSAAPAVALARLRRLLITGQARDIRKAARLNQCEMAVTIGVGRPAFTQWESGTRMPRGEPALRYLALLDELTELLSTP